MINILWLVKLTHFVPADSEVRLAQCACQLGII